MTLDFKLEGLESWCARWVSHVKKTAHVGRPGKNAHRAKKLTQQLQQKRNSTVFPAWLKDELVRTLWHDLYDAYMTFPFRMFTKFHQEHKAWEPGRALLCQEYDRCSTASTTCWKNSSPSSEVLGVPWVADAARFCSEPWKPWKSYTAVQSHTHTQAYKT